MAPPATRSFCTRIARVLGLIAVGYALCVALLAWQQNALIFKPPRAAGERVTDAELPAQTRRFAVSADGATLEAFLREGAGPAPRPTLLYAGGNAEDIVRRLRRHDDLLARGWNFAAYAYRGYGPSTGSLDAGQLGPDILKVMDALAARPEVRPDRIALFGSSLGTGPALHALKERRAIGAVLFAPYPSLAAIGSARFPWAPIRWLLRGDVDAIGAARAAEAPMLIVHGKEDDIIPFALGAEVAAAAGSRARFVALEREDHGFLIEDPRVKGPFDDFLESLRRGP